MDRRGALQLGALAMALLLIGGIAWVAGLIAVGQYWEDLCFDDLNARAGYGSYRSEASIWPPSFECRLDGSGVEAVVVRHPVVALVRFSAAVVFPVLFGLVVLLVLASSVRRRRRGPPSGRDRPEHPGSSAAD
jgi:hypothetical protein